MTGCEAAVCCGLGMGIDLAGSVTHLTTVLCYFFLT